MDSDLSTETESRIHFDGYFATGFAQVIKAGRGDSPNMSEMVIKKNQDMADLARNF